MNSARVLWFAVLTLGWEGATWAESAPIGEGLTWLNRAAVAPQKVNYSGIYVYQQGDKQEVTRIVHSVQGGSERERLESLDGSPREILRQDGEITCYLPNERLILLERENRRRGFPAVMPAALPGLAENYAVRKGSVDRVAGLDVQQIILEPKDKLRYGHQLWVDTASGLLIKSRMVDAHAAMLEQFSFTQLHIGGQVDPSELQTRLGSAVSAWQVRDGRNKDEATDVRPWQFRQGLPGFRRVSALRKTMPGKNAEVVQIVFSDGLAAVSVFIEPALGDPTQNGLFSAGATQIYKRRLGEEQITVVGSVPPQTLKRLGDSLERR